MSSTAYDDQYAPDPTECYCCWLAGVGGMPPCGFCSNPANFPTEDEDEPVVTQREETDAERFDRVMKELGL